MSLITEPTGEEQVLKRQPPLVKPVKLEKPVKQTNKKRPRVIDDDDDNYVRIDGEESDSQKKKQKLNYDAPRASQVPNLSSAKEPLNLSLEAADVSDDGSLSPERDQQTVMMIAETPTPARPILVPDTTEKVGTPAIKLDPEMEALLSNIQSDQVKSERKPSLSLQFGGAASPVVSPIHKESMNEAIAIQPRRLLFDKDDETMEDATNDKTEPELPKKHLVCDKEDEADMRKTAENIASICPKQQEKVLVEVNDATTMHVSVAKDTMIVEEATNQHHDAIFENMTMLKRSLTSTNVASISMHQLLQAQEDCITILKWVHETMAAKLNKQ